MQREFKAKRWGVNLVFTVLAVMFWILSYYLISQASAQRTGTKETIVATETVENEHFYGELAKDIGVVVFGLALVDMLWSLFGGDPLQRDLATLLASISLLDRSRKCGLIQVARTPTDLDMTHPVTAILQAKNSIDMCGFTLHTLYAKGGFKENIEVALRNKVRVRICVGSSTNRDIMLNCLSTPSGAMHGQIETVLRCLRGLKSELEIKEKDVADRLSVYELQDGFMTASILRRDRLMEVVPYLRNSDTLNSPALLLEHSGDTPLFEAYQAEFDFIISRAHKLG